MELLKSKNGRILVESHRGAEMLSVPNTWDAINKGYIAGADLIEIDVQISKDKIPFVRHNYTIGETNWCKDMAITDIQSAFGNDNKPPLLFDLLSWAKEKRANLSIDMKGGFGMSNDLYKSVISLIKSFDIDDLLLIMDWNHRALKEFKLVLPNVKTRAFIRGIPIDLVAMVQDCNVDAVSLSYDLIMRKDVRLLHKIGVAVALCEMWDLDTEMVNNMNVDIVSWGDPIELIAINQNM